MTIHSLRIQDFRNLSSVSLTPLSQGLNIISGANGSGKTSLLEAIYYLGLARSFRQAPTRSLVKHTQPAFSLFAQIMERSPHFSTLINIGMQKGLYGGLRLKMGELALSSIGELAARLPMQVIHAQSHHFFELGPLFRRKYLDWGLFYHTPEFLVCWHHYMRLLKQRNAALRRQQSKQEIAAWSESWLQYAHEFDSLRRQYVAEIKPLVLTIAAALLPGISFHLHYYPGWEEEKTLNEVLFAAYLDELRLGCTQHGPHRADLIVTIEDRPAKYHLSRGQQKLLICAMMMAQGMLLTNQAKSAPVYLIDDLPAELDAGSRKRLLMALTGLGTQVFVTAVESSTVVNVMKSYLNETPIKVFHVEHGEVSLG